MAKWLQDAIKRRGAFTRWCRQHGFKRVTMGCIVAAKKAAKRSRNRRLLGEAILAQRLKYGDLARARG